MCMEGKYTHACVLVFLSVSGGAWEGQLVWGWRLAPQHTVQGPIRVTSCYWSRLTEAGSSLTGQVHCARSSHHSAQQHNLLMGSCIDTDALYSLPPSLCNCLQLFFAHTSSTHTHTPSVWTWEYGHFSLSGTCLRKNTHGKVCWFQQDRDLNIIPAWHC